MDHLLSLIVFGAAAAEFLLWPKFGTSTYCLLAMLALVGFLSGIALRARRGTVVAQAAPVSRRTRKADPPAAELHIEPAPAPAAPAPSRPAPSPVPSVASVAESVLLDHPEPSIAQPATSPTAPAPSPEVPSPGIQPGEGTHPSPDTPPRL
jgi:hypothetical protein